MKISPVLPVLLLIALASCSTGKHLAPRRTPPPKADPPETVIVTYHVIAGQEAPLQETLARAWTLYQKENMVLYQPHVIVRDKESGGQTRFIEIFAWISHAKPAHAPDSVKTIWNQMQSFCEPRDGRPGLDGGEVDLLNPALPAAKR